MKINFIIVTLILFSTSIFAQNNLSAEEIFEKVVQHYAPEDNWAQFKGTIHISTYADDWDSEENLTIDNAANFYRSMQIVNGKVLAKGMDKGQIFFESDEMKMALANVPEKYTQAPYNMTEQNVRMSAENHISHFSLPLMMKAAGAKPSATVGNKEFFGTKCLALTFKDGLPNNYENGLFNGVITLYVDPENDYRLRGTHFANNFFGEGIGVNTYFMGEMEVNGLKLPARKLYLNERSNQPFVIDVFDLDLIEEK